MNSKFHLILCIIAISLTLFSFISLVYGLIHNIIVFNQTHVLPDFPIVSFWMFTISITLGFIIVFIPQK